MYLNLNIALNQPLHYSLVSQVNMQINRQMILQQSLEREISYALTEKDKNNAYSVLIKHAALPDDSSSGVDNTLDVGKYLNYPYENLHLKLYETGVVKKVLNQETIVEKWEKVKKMEGFKHLLDYVDEDRFFREMNPVYEDSLEYIESTPQYIVFFPPVYKTSQYRSDPFVQYGLSCSSILFPGNNIQFWNRLALDKNENGFAFFKSKTVKFDADRGKMKKMYKQGYASVIQSPWEEYLFAYEAAHKYERQTGKLVQAEAVFKEQANENLIYENRINIQLKPVEQ